VVLDAECRKTRIFLDNLKYSHGMMLMNYVKKLKANKDVRIEPVFLPPSTPNLNLIGRFWRYCEEKTPTVCYEKFEEFKAAIERFLEKEIRVKVHGISPKQFVGTAF
jgi:transposase